MTAITTDKIENSTVLAASSITNAKIATGTIANDKLTNSSITLNGSSLSLGGSALKHIDWQALTVADGSTTLTAVAGRGYFLDTNTGVIEVFYQVHLVEVILLFLLITVEHLEQINNYKHRWSK